MIFVNDNPVPVSFWLNSRVDVDPGASIDVSPSEGAAILAMGVRLRHLDLTALVASQVAPVAPVGVPPEGDALADAELAPSADSAEGDSPSPRRRRG